MSDIVYEKNLIFFADTEAPSTVGFGRCVMFTEETFIDKTNVVQELQKALAYHNINVSAINYLDRYYRGDQPILYREKKVRPEINNKIVDKFDLDEEAVAIENAVKKVIEEGYRTFDIYKEGDKKVSTSEMGELIVSRL